MEIINRPFDGPKVIMDVAHYNNIMDELKRLQTEDKEVELKKYKQVVVCCLDGLSNSDIYENMINIIKLLKGVEIKRICSGTYIIDDVVISH